MESSDRVRPAGQLDVDEIRACHRDLGGDLDAMVDRLRVSKSPCGVESRSWAWHNRALDRGFGANRPLSRHPEAGSRGDREVVLAHDDRLERLVAIKRLHDDDTATPDRRERFRREARIVARLNHPAIVQIHAVHHKGPHDYLIMEYIEGRTLREHSGSAPMTVSEVLAIAHQIALGMAAAHDLGVVHRDLKAENILITPAGRAKITDFGIAKLHGEDTLTAEGAVLGTFRAMSPEQALGHVIDHRPICSRLAFNSTRHSPGCRRSAPRPRS
jgi:predicted Ser/Thr protein kinase